MMPAIFVCYVSASGRYEVWKSQLSQTYHEQGRERQIGASARRHCTRHQAELNLYELNITDISQIKSNSFGRSVISVIVAVCDDAVGV